MVNILVVGDIFVDSYTYGTVERLAPDFAGFVFDKIKTEHALGGAANVAQNIHYLLPECNVYLQGSIGLQYDYLIDRSIRLLRVSTETMEKERLVSVSDYSNNKPKYKQKLIRIDNRKRFSVAAHGIPTNLSFDYVIFSDYNKGTITEKYLLCGSAKYFVDSKSRDLSFYSFANTIKINHIEYDNLKTELINPNVIVTYGRNPVIYKTTGGTIDVPVYDRTIKESDEYDFCGAGDTFLAGYVYGSVKGYSGEKLIRVANIAASLAVAKFGTATVYNYELEAEINKAKEIMYL